MAKFIVEIKEQWVGKVVVEAKNREEAIERAKEEATNVGIPVEFECYVASDTWEVKKTK